jgi:hypothetical protein
LKLFKSLLYISLFIVLASCSDQKHAEQPITQDGIVLSSLSTALGGQPDETELTYFVNISNKTNKAVLVKSIEPLLEEPLKSKVLIKDLVYEVNKEVNSNSTISITGKFRFDTKGLSKESILALNPNVKEFKLITEQTIGNK